MESKVCEFIDTEKKCWDLDLLNQTFIPFEAEAIAGIPLSVRLLDVKQVWSETSNGFFIVRSAYKLALELEVNREKGSYFDDTMMRQFGGVCGQSKFLIRSCVLLAMQPVLYC